MLRAGRMANTPTHAWTMGARDRAGRRPQGKRLPTKADWVHFPGEYCKFLPGSPRRVNGRRGWTQKCARVRVCVYTQRNNTRPFRNATHASNGLLQLQQALTEASAWPPRGTPNVAVDHGGGQRALRHLQLRPAGADGVQARAHGSDLVQPERVACLHAPGRHVAPCRSMPRSALSPDGRSQAACWLMVRAWTINVGSRTLTCGQSDGGRSRPSWGASSCW